MNVNEFECENKSIHAEKVEDAELSMPPEEVLYDVAELFKVFGDSTRVRIMAALSRDELCVCDLAELLKMTVSAISHQLRILRQTKLVKARKQGKEVFYSFSDEHVSKIFALAVEHIEE